MRDEVSCLDQSQTLRDMSEEDHLCLFQQDPTYPTALLVPCPHQQLLDMEIHHQNVLHSS